MKKFYILIVTLVLSISSSADTFIVNSQSSFNNALSASSSGDIIEWTSGTYSNIFMDITKAGITVKAATAGEVIFNGSSRVEIDADNITFSGFQYIGGNIGTSHVVRIYGSNVFFTNVNISQYTSYKYLIIQDQSQYTTVSYCNFENRINTPDQNILSILVSSSQAGFHKIQYCSFKNFSGSTPGGDAGVEPIRIGVSSTAMYESKSIVEYCYFTQCNGDGEIISHKARQCVYRYNTFDDNPYAELVLRHGDAGIVYGNFFTNGYGGIRIQEASDHLIFNNYFSGLTNRSLNLNNGSTDRLNNILIAYNTFVNSAPIDMENGTNEAENVTLANNIFAYPSDSELFEDVTGIETWIGNIANGTLGSANSTNFTLTDPLLATNGQGYYEITVTSPAIDNSVAGFPTLPIYSDLNYDNNILLDIILNARPSIITDKDVGCEEYNASSVVKPHVNEDNTGPTYLMPTLSVSNSIKNLDNGINFYPNPVKDSDITFNFNFNINTLVTIELYDLKGQKLKTLVNKHYSNGTYTNKIDFSSGVYLLVFNVKDTFSNTSISKTERLIKL
ncbi:T9SS type A sorting domain-containing protein [Seonamhaeicola sp. MEBiC1930]|uniref:chondroitinase-B domain-containing protein n=1 Tax=Seonamhaeicola sp. MEBiC01930 TaxID=2976768 RepID=UPI003249AF38